METPMFGAGVDKSLCLFTCILAVSVMAM